MIHEEQYQQKTHTHTHTHTKGELTRGRERERAYKRKPCWPMVYPLFKSQRQGLGFSK
jgi:hypothetical protein